MSLYAKVCVYYGIFLHTSSVRPSRLYWNVLGNTVPMWTNTQGTELKYETKFKGWCPNLEGYIFNLWPRALDKFSRTMKEMDRYLGTTYDSCQPEIMTETLETLPNPEMLTIIPDTDSENLKTEREINHLEKKNIEEAIHQKTNKKDVYETDMHNI